MSFVEEPLISMPLQLRLCNSDGTPRPVDDIASDLVNAFYATVLSPGEQPEPHQYANNLEKARMTARVLLEQIGKQAADSVRRSIH